MTMDISIHASREGSDRSLPLSTVSTVNFNPRFPRGKRPFSIASAVFRSHFNPRFPRGKRRVRCPIAQPSGKFQSTLPAREATFIVPPPVTKIPDFNPRFPRGKRRRRSWRPLPTCLFQSTLPAREATYLVPSEPAHKAISIHASREGSDPCSFR